MFKNGDKFDPGTRVVVTNRKYRTFGVLLDDLSSKVKLANGAVRHLYTPRNGHEVQSLNSLKHDGKYICASVGKLKKEKYGDRRLFHG